MASSTSGLGVALGAGARARPIRLALILSLLALAGCPQPESVICSSGRICPKNFYCAAHQDICIPIDKACGNGVVDKLEVCDDGNVINDDDCSRDCKSNNECGNGQVDTFDDPSRNEMCDEGRELNGLPMHCTSDCKSNGLCGNGYRENGESCDYCADDGPADAAPGDAALDAARDGALDGADDGAGSDAGGAGDAGSNSNSVCGRYESRTCNHDCSERRCGDRKINRAAGEACDDGGESKDCNLDCTIATCGDGKVNPTAGEACDITGGADTRNCIGAGVLARTAGVACHLSECGDGYVNAAAGEECDVLGGADTRDCNGKLAQGVACRFSHCGDGYVNQAAGESCDVLGGGDTRDCNGAAAATPTPATNKACLAAACGDGYVNRAAGEACEVPADGSDTALCNGFLALALRCTLSSCGDTYVNGMAGEECEPPGGADSATCNGRDAGGVRCKLRRCADGYLNRVVETCEVTTSGADTSACNGTSAPVAIQCHDVSCGDGYANGAAGETCDDSNGSDSASCNGNGAVALRCKVPTCGDGYINAGAGEECDDRNASSSDGCSSICKKEPGFNCPTAGVACTAVCGDGIQVTSEACDDYNSDGCGTCNGSCRVAQTPAAATGTITVGSNGNGVTFNSNNTETFSLSDGIHARVTFRFTSVAAPPGIVAVDIGSNTGGTQMATKIANAINSVGRALAINAGVSATNSRQVVLVNSNPGSLGNNQPVNDTVADTDFVVSGMSGGVGYDCPTATGCKDGRDCLSGVCSVSHACQPATCADNVLNGTESDTDCGGGNAACPRCADGDGCILDSDCGANSKCTAGSCVTTCGDGNLNGTETDTDCGGGCSPCPNGKKCGVNQDCQSGSQCGVPPPPIVDGGTADGGTVDAGTTRVCF